MNTKETQKLDDILILNQSALKQYELLAKLDIERKNKTPEYQDILNNLHMISDIIEKKLASLNISNKDLLEYEANLAQKYDYEDEDILVETIFQNIHNLPVKRLSNQIYNYSLLNYCYTSEDEYTDEDFTDYEEEITESIEEDLKKELDFDLLKDRLVNHTFFAYLEDAIAKETNEYVKNILIKTKYYIIYLLYPFESKFLENQDKYYNPTVIQEIITRQEEHVDLEEEFIIPNEETIIENLECIAYVTDEYYDNFDNSVQMYIFSLYIKTLISINISKPADKRLEDFRKKLKLNSSKSKRFVDEAYNISKKLSVVKKVDF